MAARLTAADVQRFLAALGSRIRTPSDLFLVGGGALCLLGSARFTQDLDFVGPAPPAPDDEFTRTIHALAEELAIDVESVPIQLFAPIPAGAEMRHRLVGTFGSLRVLVFDPYTIALSKLDRGLEADLQDVEFLARAGLIELDQLVQMASDAARFATEFDLDVPGMLSRLAALLNRLKTSGTA